MTLILSLSNARQVIQLSDRRLTSLGSGQLPKAVLTDSANKAGIFECSDARLAFGFTGLAYTMNGLGVREFETGAWLCNALIQSALKDFRIQSIVEKLRQQLTDTFQSTPSIVALSKSDRRLSVMLSGYWYSTVGWIPSGWIITNYQNRFDPAWFGVDTEEAAAKFEVWRWHESVPPGPDPFALIQRIGQWSSVSTIALNRLEALLRKDIPAAGLIGAALRVMHEASEAGSSGGTVGKHISIITVPRHVLDTVCLQEEADVITDEVWLPNWVIARHAGLIHNGSVFMGRVPGNPNSPPSILPRVRKSAPCPCRSGRRYAECHRRSRQDVART